MAATNWELIDDSALTPAECKFIVQTLESIQLSGKPTSLRQALDTIESIIEKLSVGDEMQGDSVDS